MRRNILVGAAAGQVARFVIDLFLEQADACLTLFLRRARRLNKTQSDRMRVVDADMVDLKTLQAAMEGQGVVLRAHRGHNRKKCDHRWHAKEIRPITAK